MKYKQSNPQFLPFLPSFANCCILVHIPFVPSLFSFKENKKSNEIAMLCVLCVCVCVCVCTLCNNIFLNIHTIRQALKKYKRCNIINYVFYSIYMIAKNMTLLNNSF